MQFSSLTKTKMFFGFSSAESCCRKKYLIGWLCQESNIGSDKHFRWGLFWEKNKNLRQSSERAPEWWWNLSFYLGQQIIIYSRGSSQTTCNWILLIIRCASVILMLYSHFHSFFHFYISLMISCSSKLVSSVMILQTTTLS